MKLKRIVVLLAVMAGLSGTVAETCPVIPFVAVTGRPAEADVVRKVARLKEMGYDQFLIYARSGLQYAYMGEEWLRLNEWFCLLSRGLGDVYKRQRRTARTAGRSSLRRRAG